MPLKLTAAGSVCAGSFARRATR